MRPALSVLQLDTHFPRVPGDVACPQTYTAQIEVLRVPNASVGKIVTARPDLIDIAPFEQALEQARGDIVVTSCGFLIYWQDHLAAIAQRRGQVFISSSLVALDRISRRFSPEEVVILTYDSDCLSARHFGKYDNFRASVIGLPEASHLRRVISGDHPHLDAGRANEEVSALIHKRQNPKHILLECTNLPPYKRALRLKTKASVSDILTEIESLRPNTVCPDYN